MASRRLISFLLVVLTATATQAAYQQVQVPLEQLPQEHEYQRSLRAYMATLTAKDFEVELKPITLVPTSDAGEQYRMWLLGLTPYNVSGAALPAEPFTLKAIESGKGLVLPCVPSECQLMAWLASWEYAGNPHRGSRALKLRAFVLAATDMMVLDYLYDHDPRDADRADYLGGNLIWIGRTYMWAKDALPETTRTAFEAGLKRHVLRINSWGPKGQMTDMDLFAPVGLWYVAQNTSDPEIKKTAEQYSRQLFTDSHYFNAAGYFVDNNCFDTSYNGISLFFGTWAAMMTDWKYTHEAIDKAFLLRAHLCYPDPEGNFSGPSAMASRCSGDPPHDQWQFSSKTYGAGMVSDQALYFAQLPAEAVLKAAPEAVINQLNNHLSKPREAAPQPWKESHWAGPMNFVYELYRKGDYERRLKLTQENSPLLKPLYAREGNFIREFGKAFTIVRFDSYAAAVHTGPVGGIHKGWQRPYGHGGGQLTAFWTPATGAVSLGRRRGIQGAVYDSFEEWRIWPVHTVSGVTTEGHFISSSRIQQPEVKSKLGKTQAEVEVKGTLPKYFADEKRVVDTDLKYEREFKLRASGVSVTTSIESDKKETFAELYETIPVFLAENDGQKPATIQFQVDGKWVEPTVEPQKVKAVRIERFSGAALITFDKPASVRLSPTEWRDGFQTQGRCRTLLVDLLGGKPGKVGAASVSYTFSAAEPKAAAAAK